MEFVLRFLFQAKLEQDEQAELFHSCFSNKEGVNALKRCVKVEARG